MECKDHENPDRRARIIFPTGRTIEVQGGASAWEAIRAAGLPLASSCDGDGVCGKCRVEIVEGGEYCSQPTTMELQHARAGNERLACQVHVSGPVHLRVTYW